MVHQSDWTLLQTIRKPKLGCSYLNDLSIYRPTKMSINPWTVKEPISRTQKFKDGPCVLYFRRDMHFYLLTSFVQPLYQLLPGWKCVHPSTNSLSDCPAMKWCANLPVSCRGSIIQRTPEKHKRERQNGLSIFFIGGRSSSSVKCSTIFCTINIT